MMDISVSLQKIETKFLKMYHYRPNIQDTSIFMFSIISIPGSCHIWKDTDLQLVTHALSHRATWSHQMSSRSLVEQLITRRVRPFQILPPFSRAGDHINLFVIKAMA